MPLLRGPSTDVGVQGPAVITASALWSGRRLVLSAVSDYFAAMFTNDVREAKEEEIKMEGVDPEALRSLVHYAYTGACSPALLRPAQQRNGGRKTTVVFAAINPI